MTLLGLLFSIGNALVGLMFWYMSNDLPFKHKRNVWATIMVLYTIIFTFNMIFSVYLIFGKLFGGNEVDLPASWQHWSDADAEGDLFGLGGLLKKIGIGKNDEWEKKKKSDSEFSVGQETYLGQQLYDLLCPGTFLTPYMTWPLVGYPLMRWLRLFNFFIPFTDDIRS